VCSLNLHAYSTFMKTMTVEGVTVDNGSVTYEYADENEGGDDELPEIAPNQLTNIGRLTFDPRQQCQVNCYSSFDLLSKPFGVKWMSTLDNYTLYNRLDSEKLMAQLQLFNATREFVKNVSFRLTTTQVRRLEYNATINYVWPKLLTETIIQFPVIQIEQEAVKFITLHNPSDHLLFVHYILHDPQLHGTLSWLDQFAGGVASKGSLIQAANIIHPCENCSLSDKPSMFGFLFDEGEIYVNYVKPKSVVKIGLKFTATEPGSYSTILYMRNNLTTMDAIWITGKAAVPQFKFGNRKPGSPTALLFEIVDKHTKVCEQPVTQAISTKRTFTARNYGEVPILISGECMVCQTKIHILSRNFEKIEIFDIVDSTESIEIS
jgi:Transmembrane protein 131-like